jgi:predicted ATPase/transcriptional regulator with XRE-family HTH domain
MTKHPPESDPGSPDGTPTLFGDLLRRHRWAKRLTQERLAELAGLSGRGINDLERGERRSPRFDTVERLAEALGLADGERAAFAAAARQDPAASLARTPPDTVLPLRTRDSHPHHHNLPLQPTPLLGRERELADVGTLLHQDDVRLVTLTGPGGIGKTRLSVQVAADVLDHFADGVWFVRLARLTDPSLVLPTVAQTVDLKDLGSRPIGETLREHLRDKRLLLVLDNCEHLVAAATDVAGLLETCPGVKVLATSRVVLRLRGERRVPISPLELPDHRLPATPERLAQSAAVALFVERAHEALPDFELSNANGAAVAEICARLDGLPLAIELVAARVKVLPPRALLNHLERALPLLTGGPHDLEQHQRTMQATLAWSYELLSTEEQRLFRRLAAFAGGCTLEAAEAVCATPEGGEPLAISVLDGLSALVDQSLLQQRTEGEGGEPRYGMLHVIREYALEQLEASGEAEVLRRAHAACFVDVAEQAWWVEAETQPGSGPLSGSLARELANVRAALGWLGARAKQARTAGASGAPTAEAERGAAVPGIESPVIQGLRLAGAQVWVWAEHGHLSEGRAWLETFLALDAASPLSTTDQEQTTAGTSGMSAVSPAPRRGWTADVPQVGEAYARGRALYACGVLRFWQGDYDQAVLPLEHSLALARAIGDRLAIAGILDNLAMAVQAQGDLERARVLYEESLALARAGGWKFGIGNALLNLSSLSLAAGDLERAEVLSAEALTISRRAHYHTGAAASLVVQALIAWRRGHLDRAAALAEEALVEHHMAQDVRHYGDGLEVCAIVAAAMEHAEHAARLLGAAAASRERIGMRWSMYAPTADEIAAAVAPARATLGEQTWAAVFAEGRALALEEAIAAVLNRSL